MGWFHRFKYRSLRVDILTIFLILIATSSTFIISFTYSRDSQSVTTFSKQTIELAGSLISDRVEALMQSSERIVEMAARLFTESEEISVENKEQLSHLLSIAEFYSPLYGLYYATDRGNFIEVVNLEVAGQTHSLGNPTQPAPAGSVYGLRVIEKGADTWYWVSESHEILGSEPIVGAGFDPRARPWYNGAIAAGGQIYWTDVYRFLGIIESASSDGARGLKSIEGITASKALFDGGKTPVAVVGADLSLGFLSDFLDGCVIGKTGQAFVLDTQGRALIPSHGSRIAPEVLQAVTAALQQGKTDAIVEVSGAEYIASLHGLPQTVHKPWAVLVVVPLDDFLSGFLSTQRQVALISIAIAALAALVAIYFSKRISQPIVRLSIETDRIKHLDLDSDTRVDSHIKEIRLMDDSIASMRVALRSFSRYIPKEVVLQLLSKGQELTIGGEKKEVTILFTDISGFTTLAEQFPTEELMAHLTDYFSALSKNLLQYQATIDKYLGDGIMAFWGAPTPVEEPVAQACRAALACQKIVAEFNAESVRSGKPVFLTRFGLHSGTAIVGNIGTMERMNYTIMGDSVNVASRLQPLNKIYKTSIIVSEELAAQVSGEFVFRVLDEVELRGKKRKTKVLELMADTPEQRELAKLFGEGFAAYTAQNRERARAIFLALQQKFPADEPTKLMLERLG